MTHTDILDRAAEDMTLSARAAGVLLRLVRLADEDGRIPAKTEAHKHFTEGRDAIGVAYDELAQKDYITRNQFRVKGAHRTTWLLVHRTGFSGTPLTTLNSPTDSESDLSTQSVLRTDDAARGAASQEVRVTIGALPEDDEPIEDSKPRKRRAPVVEDEGAGIGSLPDEQPERRPGRATSAAVAAKHLPKARGGYVDKRDQKTPSQYSIPDILAEFGDRVREHVKTKYQDHTNHAAFTRNISAWRRSGVAPDVILVTMDMFFSDRRNLHTLSDDRPLWLKFTIFFQQNQGQAAKRVSAKTSAPKSDSPVLGAMDW